LIEHLTDKPATLFGNSSGAIVALEVFIHAPERVQTVVAHEPPVVNLLPDAAKWLAFFDPSAKGSLTGERVLEGIPTMSLACFLGGLAASSASETFSRPVCSGKSASPYWRAYDAHWRNWYDERYAELSLDTARLARDSSPCSWLYPLSNAEQETSALDAPVRQRIAALHCWDDHLVYRAVWILTRWSNTRHKHKKTCRIWG